MNSIKKSLGAVYRDPLYQALVFGATTSRLATLAFGTALSLHVLKLTGSPRDLSLTLIMGTVPLFALSMISGIICDRFDKRKIILISDMARVLIGMGFLISTLVLPEQANLGVIYTAVVLFSVFEAFVSTSFSSIIPEVVNPEDIVDVNLAFSGVMESVRLIGPMLGASLYAFVGIKILLILVILCFLGSFIVERKIPSRPKNTRLKGQGILDIVKHEFSGFRTLLTSDHRIVSLFFNGFATHLFLFPFLFIGTPYLITELLGGHSAEYGIVEMFASVGGLLSILLVPSQKHLGAARNLLVGMSGMILGCLVFVLLLSPYFFEILRTSVISRVSFFAMANTAIFLSFGFYGIFFSSFLQENIAPENMGKGMSIVMMFNSLGRMIGFSLFGIMFNRSLAFTVGVLVVGISLKVLIHIPFLLTDRKMRVHQV